ncbi:MAG TPA: carboxypeptidase-like regulatory domain-containing protein [Gemmataceae bacterium]
MKAAFAIPRCRIGLVVPVILLSLGCGGGPKGDISGKVTYLGKPLPGGAVTFFGAENRVVGSSAISPEGNYSIAKVPAGPVKITVTVVDVPAQLSKDKSNFSGKAPPPPEGADPNAPKWKPQQHSPNPVGIPAKYKMPDQSGLTYTVQPGPQEHPIDLK